MENILRSLVGEHPKQWDQVLAQAEFSYNDSFNRSTGQSQFHIVCGIHQRGVHKLRNSSKDEVRSVEEENFSSEIQEIHEQVKQQL